MSKPCKPIPESYFNTEPQKEVLMISTSRYARKPFYVDAIQVTAENMEEVAAWCLGEIRQFETEPSELGSRTNNYIKVRVHRPMNERQTKAYVGDWVLYAGTGYKVYTPKAFEASFDATREADTMILPKEKTSDEPHPEIEAMLVGEEA
jgi:hypothetical protein